MRKDIFKQWLEKRGLSERPVCDYLSRCSRVEAQLGDLDAAYLQDKLASILSQLVKDNADFPMDGDRVRGMSSLRTAVRSYAEFCDACPPGFLPEQDTADEPAPCRDAGPLHIPIRMSRHPPEQTRNCVRCGSGD